MAARDNATPCRLQADQSVGIGIVRLVVPPLQIEQSSDPLAVVVNASFVVIAPRLGDFTLEAAIDNDARRRRTTLLGRTAHGSGGALNA